MLQTMKFYLGLSMSVLLFSNTPSIAQHDPFVHPEMAQATNMEAAVPEDTSSIEIPAPKGKSILDHEFELALQSEIEFKIPILTCHQLRDMKEKYKTGFVILDTRTDTEFKVSHLPGARRVGCEDFSNERVWSINRNYIIVLYSSSGEHSEKVGERMREMGFKNIYNLYGSIFEWVNQGNSIVDDKGEPTQKVHVLDKTNTKWLKKGKAIY